MTSPVPAAAPLPADRPSPQTIRFPVTGMVCGSCVSRITRALRSVEGVDRVRVDLGRETVTVRRDPRSASDARLAIAIAEAGYEAHLEAAQPTDPAEALGRLARLLRRTR